MNILFVQVNLFFLKERKDFQRRFVNGSKMKEILVGTDTLQISFIKKITQQIKTAKLDCKMNRKIVFVVFGVWICSVFKKEIEKFSSTSVYASVMKHVLLFCCKLLHQLFHFQVFICKIKIEIEIKIKNKNKK